MLKIQTLFILAVFPTLLLAQDNVCDEDHLENCFGQTMPDDAENIARSSKMQYNKLTHDLDKLTIPENFDPREHWPNCAEVIGKIVSQQCSLCWAYSGAMAFMDRVCVAANGTNNETKSVFSVLDAAACCEKCSSMDKPRCSTGGETVSSFTYYIEHGTVLEECRPFDLDETKRLPKCVEKCTDKNKKYTDYLHKAKNGVFLAKYKDHRQIQADIMQYGSISCMIKYLSKDFLQYHDTKKVFVEAKEDKIPGSGHAMRLIGWGTEDGVDYWLIANTWGKRWGDKGFGKINRDPDKNLFEINRFFVILYTEPMPMLAPTKAVATDSTPVAGDPTDPGLTGSRAPKLSLVNFFVFTLTLYVLTGRFVSCF